MSNSYNSHAIDPLTGINYKKWKQDVEIVLGVMDLDLALRDDEPARPAEGASASQRSKYEKWQKANRISLMIIKRAITDAVRGGIPDCKTAKEYLAAIEDRYLESEKAETGVLMHSLTTIRFDGNGSIREHILTMIDLASKLKNLELYVFNKKPESSVTNL
ncbi:uncharacterized protein LOC110768153 [Prunus avium]|uniref:Uncharacterized protein LOC110768153 n=1 Tax=Prunus avium TaxID=42229 RepID=A0A6P5TK38_PRUAV|nr:uncharacterized protein LOC110768153 [Prunus avium]